MSQSITYQLPEYYDPDNDSTVEIELRPVRNQNYPDFMIFDREQRTITFLPNKKRQEGNMYYFDIVLYEKEYINI